MTFNFKNKQKNKLPLSNENGAGFTIIELIATIAILSFGIIGVYSAFSPFVFLTYNISSRFTAADLAQEGLEIVRNIRDDNFIKRISDPGITWSDGLLNCGLGCQVDYKTGTSAQNSNNQLMAYDPNNFLKLNEDGFYGYDTGDNTQFKRKIKINQVESDTLKITVQVFWDYNGKPYCFEAEEYLYNWY